MKTIPKPTDNFIADLLNKPKIIGLIGETNQGKSNFLYYLVSQIIRNYNFNLVTYGIRHDLGESKIFSLKELETVANSIIICDEFYTLFDLEDRKSRKAIENSLRLIHHNNNILVLSGLPDNFKKFIASKLDVILFKKCAVDSFINGSKTKKTCIAYKGAELGSSVLNLKINEILVYDKSYYKIEIPYIKEHDTKKDNQVILRKK